VLWLSAARRQPNACVTGLHRVQVARPEVPAQAFISTTEYHSMIKTKEPTTSRRALLAGEMTKLIRKQLPRKARKCCIAETVGPKDPAALG
jgi:hypothetical protein